LLDIGCGSGELLAVGKAAKFEQVYGLDIAQPVVKRALDTCEAFLGSLDGVVIQQADLNERLPFPDAFFDAVAAVAVVEHIFDPYFTVAEIWRMLKPRGHVILEVPNLVWLPRRLDVVL